MQPEITLYGYTTSPYVRKVSCYLYYKGLDFTFTPVNPVAPADTIGFTGGTQVPVLKIGDEFRRDSSKLGIWLDTLFPEKPLLGKNAEERAAITRIDDWVSNQFIPGMLFRMMVDGPKDDAFRSRGHRLAAIVSASTPMPNAVREGWPDLIANAPFIQDLANMMDRSEPVEVMQMRLFGELVAHLGDGPFMGGLDSPSLADFALYPQLAFPYEVGLMNSMPLLAHDTLGPWLRRMHGLLPQNPWCVPESVLVRGLLD